MRKRVTSRRPVSVRLSVGHTRELYNIKTITNLFPRFRSPPIWFFFESMRSFHIPREGVEKFANQISANVSQCLGNRRRRSMVAMEH